MGILELGVPGRGPSTVEDVNREREFLINRYKNMTTNSLINLVTVLQRNGEYQGDTVRLAELELMDRDIEESDEDWMFIMRHHTDSELAAITDEELSKHKGDSDRSIAAQTELRERGLYVKWVKSGLYQLRFTDPSKPENTYSNPKFVGACKTPEEFMERTRLLESAPNVDPGIRLN